MLLRIIMLNVVLDATLWVERRGDPDVDYSSSSIASVCAETFMRGSFQISWDIGVPCMGFGMSRVKER